jgi:hypothetical protein
MPEAYLQELLDNYAKSDPRLDIWRRYPDISEEEDAYTDRWACEAVSDEFAVFARRHGWDAVVIFAEEAEKPFADYHAWVRLSRGTDTYDVDWTARQYHNLDNEEGHDEAVLTLPWPLVWKDTGVHPIVGSFAKIDYVEEENA